MTGPFRDLTVNCSIMLADLPLLERPAAAAAAGFSGKSGLPPAASGRL